MRFLILKPSSLGDVVQALPVLRMLRRTYPTAEIYWWISESLAPLIEEDPDLDGLFYFDRHGWRSLSGWRVLVGQVRAIRAKRFDWIIDLQGLLRSGLLAWLGSASRTIGVEDPREKAGAFYDWAVSRPSPQAHAIDWYLAVLRQMAVPVHDDFVWLPEKPAAARRVHEKWRPDEHEWVGVIPGARWPNKRWPEERFAAVVKELARAAPLRGFVILGGDGDHATASAIARAAPDRCLNLAGKTDLSEMVEWIRHCRVVVTNDSGPMHVASALDRPTLALFGPTDPARTGPYRGPRQIFQGEVECAPCLDKRCRHAVFQQCMRQIEPRPVAEAVRRMMGD